MGNIPREDSGGRDQQVEKEEGLTWLEAGRVGRGGRL